MISYFATCSTQEEAKATFRKLAKLYHPDVGGSSTKMKELQKQYDEWKPPSSNAFREETIYRPYGFNTTTNFYNRDSSFNRVHPNPFDNSLTLKMECESLNRQLNHERAELRACIYDIQTLKAKLNASELFASDLRKMNMALEIELRTLKNKKGWWQSLVDYITRYN